ncbi:hypothetical protein [uncultured Christiangramia sp.]|uniref:hypothetical protein n=1 Tax=uncultured Christiangramia sp. TaxID=503836 RepID=UPI0026150E1E|nr:hypothetical protein [uncultured Christiangramia sp.]
MLTYELIKLLEDQGILNKLLGKGIVSVNYLNGKEMYECFLEYIDEGETKMDAYFKTSIDFKCSTKTVERMVIKMES